MHSTKETVAAATRVDGKRAPEKAWVIFSEIPLPSLLEMYARYGGDIGEICELTLRPTLPLTLTRTPNSDPHLLEKVRSMRASVELIQLKKRSRPESSRAKQPNTHLGLNMAAARIWATMPWSWFGFGFGFGLG